MRRSRSSCATCAARRCRRSAASRSASSRNRSREILAFTQGDLDFVALGGDDTKRVLENGKLRPDLAKRGHQARPLRLAERHVHVLQHGRSGRRRLLDAADRAAPRDRHGLRRRRADPRAVRRQRAAREPVAAAGRQRARSGAARQVALYDPAGARALLDRFGFKDRDGDGYRETPDGKPLTVVRGTLPESWYREADTLWKKNMDAIGIRMQVQQQTFAELLNMSRSGKLPMFNLGYRSLEPSGYQILQTLWGKSPRDTNPSQFKQADYDTAYEQFLRTPAGPARVALARKMSEISQAYMPMILHTYGVGNVLLLSVGAGLLAVGVRVLVEVSRRRRRDAQRQRATVRQASERCARDDGAGSGLGRQAPRRTASRAACRAGRAAPPRARTRGSCAASSICFSICRSSFSRSFSGIAAYFASHLRRLLLLALLVDVVHAIDHVLDALLDTLRRDAHLLRCAAICFARRRSVSPIARLHRVGHAVGIEDRLAVDVPRRAADRLDQRALRAQEAFLVRVENRDQRHLGNVESFAQQVDADQHVEFARAAGRG